MRTKYLSGKLDGKEHLQDLDIDGWILKSITENLNEMKCGGMYSIHVARYRDQWRGFVYTVMKFRAQFLHSLSYIIFSRRTMFHVVSKMSLQDGFLLIKKSYPCAKHQVMKAYRGRGGANIHAF